jgi:hypothetical protein
LALQAQMDVTREDQEKINTFSRLNTKLHEIQALVSAKKVREPPYRLPSPWTTTQPLAGGLADGLAGRRAAWLKGPPAWLAL